MENSPLGRLRERTKRDESDSGDGSGNVSDAGLDLTGSGHSSRRVQGLWLALPIESDLVQNALSYAQSSQIWYENALKTSSQVLGRVGFSRTFYLLTFFQFYTSVFFLLWSCRLQYLFPPCKKRNRFSHSTLSVRVFRWKRTYGGSTSPLRRILDQFLRSRPGQLPKLKKTFLHGHSILHDRLLNEREKNDIETI